MSDTALAFSGGKDSLACWYLCRESDPYVVWVNTGKAYPETLAVIDMVRSQTDRFIEVNTDQAAQNATNGLPSDVMSVDHTIFGMAFSGEKATKVQPYLQCCFENINKPFYDAVKALGVKYVIRGQRLEESHKSPTRHGDSADGITYLHPIEDWTKDEVMEFLASHGEVPAHFSLDHSSLDCYDCTAFLNHSADRMEWAAKKHPDLHARHVIRLRLLRETIAPSVALLDRFCEVSQ